VNVVGGNCAASKKCTSQGEGAILPIIEKKGVSWHHKKFGAAFEGRSQTKHATIITMGDDGNKVISSGKGSLLVF
jgi:hypothetical protein